MATTKTELGRRVTRFVLDGVQVAAFCMFVGFLYYYGATRNKKDDAPRTYLY
jgi:hypothetical protein